MNDFAWHSQTVSESAARLHTNVAQGLGAGEAARRLVEHGPNELGEPARRSNWALLADQFRSLIVGLLVAAGAVALVLGEAAEAIAIVVVIALNATIGFATEWKAATALAGLRKQSVATAQVFRDRQLRQVPASDLVPGDVVVVAAGDRVPADGRVIEEARLRVDEAALTGESLPIAKTTKRVAALETALGDRTSMMHMGTTVSSGRGKLLVTSTGPETEVGKIGALIDAVEKHGTPLEAKLAQLSRALLWLVLGLCAVIVLVGWLRGNGFLAMLETGISLAIAAVPEGLLAVTTMTLAIGMQRMAKMNALVRRLPAVEALGSTTVICSDKTGTLTRNEMTVQAFEVAGQRFAVTGIGYGVAGEFQIDAKTVQPTEALRLALRIGALCNDATLDDASGAVAVLGDPTEAALLIAADKAGLDRVLLAHQYPRMKERPFDDESKRMATVHGQPNGRLIAYVKGAPASVLEVSSSYWGGNGPTPLTEAVRAELRAQNEALAASALRVLGLAYRELPVDHSELDLARELTFVGLVGMLDPLRSEARSAISFCREAGIRVVMITGDQLATATEIARQLGIDLDAEGNPLRAVHGRDLNDLSPAAWSDLVRSASVFARVSPEHKLQIVTALQQLGNVVAMTGDGVNDAAALQKADIGVAMGIRGTEVAKDASALIITDDNLATIVGAIEQGRIVVQNLLRFIHYLFSCNCAEILTMFAAVLLGWPLPLGVLQILWLNLVTDVFPAMALALEPSAPDVMKLPPRDPNEPLMTRRFGWLIAWQGGLLSACALAAFAVGMAWYGRDGQGLRHAVTLAFMTLALAQVFHAFNVRSRTLSVFSGQFFRNAWFWGATFVCFGLQVAAVTVPFLRDLLHTERLTAVDWGAVLAGALIPVAVVELIKWTQRRVTAAHGSG